MTYLLNFKNWKNLHESAILNEEDVFETTFPDAKAASDVFKKAFASKTPRVTYAGAYHYFYTSSYNPNTTGYNDYDVYIIGLGLRKYTDGYFPDVAYGDESVKAYWSDMQGLQSPTNWPDFVNSGSKQWKLTPNDTSTALADVANINKRFNVIPLADLQKMIVKYPTISSYMANIRESKPDFYKALTGNALELYKAAVKTQPAPAPVKKP